MSSPQPVRRRPTRPPEVANPVRWACALCGAFVSGQNAAAALEELGRHYDVVHLEHRGGGSHTQSRVAEA